MQNAEDAKSMENLLYPESPMASAGILNPGESTFGLRTNTWHGFTFSDQRLEDMQIV